METPPTLLEDKILLLKNRKHYLSRPGRKGRFLRALLRSVKEELAIIKEAAREQNPLAVFKPSYDQALILNSWIFGIAFNCIYSANRIGKTTASFLNFLLWIIPNDPTLRIFRPYHVADPKEDPDNQHLPQDHPHRQRLVHVLRRPDIASLAAIARFARTFTTRFPHARRPDPSQPYYATTNKDYIAQLKLSVPSAFRPAFPRPPWNRNGTIWFGAPDQDHHEKIMFPLFREYTPAAFLSRYVPSAREITFVIPPSPSAPPNTPTRTWQLVGKSYESKDTKWSSGAVDVICLTEGVDAETFKEIKLRFKDPGIGSHDFTPYLAANAGAASHLAQRIHLGKEPLPIPYHVFTGLSVYNAPRHVISKAKQRGLIKSFKDDPQGAARLDGRFYTSSALVLAHLSDHHQLDTDLRQLLRRFPTARFLRGIDPGLDHPTACAWALLLPTNQLIIYRIMSESGLSISERAQKIIRLSNNTRQKIRISPTVSYYKEVHSRPNSEVFLASPTDYHIFKEDEVTGRPYSLNYILQGLQVTESIHLGPEQRATNLDEDFTLSNFLPHPLTGKPPGARVYFATRGQGVLTALGKLQELYWERLRSGDNKGQPKDKIPTHGDDELDAICYVTCSPFRWTREAPRPTLPQELEPEEELAIAARSISPFRAAVHYGPRSSLLHSNATHQKQLALPVSHFGDPTQAQDEEDAT